jgi:hypothetical protein
MRTSHSSQTELECATPSSGTSRSYVEGGAAASLKSVLGLLQFGGLENENATPRRCLPMITDVDTLTGESASADFKSSFDPQSKQDWCELIKDIIAMSNSGGGLIIVGVDDDGNPLANMDVAPLLAVDPPT